MNRLRVIIFVLIPSMSIVLNAQCMDMEKIRANYQKAISDKVLCQTMIETLSKITESSVHLAYLGGFQTLWANHVVNPFSKLNTFNEGKGNIENAVSADPKNAEIRFIRLSVQKNCPSFLGYRDKIEEDKNIIRANMKYITSPVLKKMIADIIYN